MKNLIKKLILKLTLQTPSILKNIKSKLNVDSISIKTKISLNNIGPDIYEKLNLEQRSFGELNKDKIFYVIKRTPGTGMFSNITFILNHLKICQKHNFIPIIDMENFITIYNEEGKIKNNFNAWNYYFNNLSSYSSGDLVIIPPNIPHTWSSQSNRNDALVIQFSRELVYSGGEFNELYKFLSEGCGFSFENADALKLKKKLLSQKKRQRIKKTNKIFSNA